MRPIGAACSVLGLAGFTLVLCCVGFGSLAAQQRTIAAPQANAPLSDEDQLAPSQMKQATPAAVSEPIASPDRSSSHPVRAATVAASPAPAAAAHKPAPPAAARTVIACSGPFARDSGMLALAMVYDSRNMIFTEESVQGSKVGVTVLYPKDPKRRLEVWWSNANRTGLFLIDIAGKSIWTGPDGLRLGLTLPELEKLNHKPFKLTGFGKDGIANVSDWDGGALAALPGGCKPSMSFRPDPKASEDSVIAIAADQEFSSGDPVIRAVKPTVSEILIGY